MFMVYSKMISGSLKCAASDLNLKLTLSGGQSFRWKALNDKEWIGTMKGCVFILRQQEDLLEFDLVGDLLSKNSKTSRKSKDYENILRQYFRLDFNLKEHYEKWGGCHSHFKATANTFQAVRVLDQDPVENIFSFICSQNNHINRISAMVEKLCDKYGDKICTYKGVDYFAFPKVESLAGPKVEQELRDAKFGYRAKFIHGTAKAILEFGGEDSLQKFRELPYPETYAKLNTLPGIGPKVADCICLMSMDKLMAVPVDTHIYNIARDHYLPSLRKGKTVTAKVYSEIGNAFRSIYGPYAGWAQTVLFCSDLQRFKKETD